MSDDEIWKGLEGSGGKYHISSHGNVKHCKSGRVVKPCVLKGHGYLYIDTRGDREKRRYIIHRWVAHHFLGVRPAGMVINHIDGNKQNNHYLNLEYCTSSENSKHAYRLGLSRADGQYNGQSKLTAARVAEIRASNKSSKELAAQFGVSPATINDARAGRRWAAVNKPTATV